MSQIGEPRRIITVEPVFEPLPLKEQPNEPTPVERPVDPVTEPSELPV